MQFILEYLSIHLEYVYKRWRHYNVIINHYLAISTLGCIKYYQTSATILEMLLGYVQI